MLHGGLTAGPITGEQRRPSREARMGKDKETCTRHVCRNGREAATDG